MGLLDSVIGALGQGGAQNPQAALINAIIGTLGQGGGGAGGLGAALGGALGGGGAAGGLGGLAGLVEQFNRAGLGDVVDSWVGTGSNLPVSADQIGQVLGGDTVRSMAGELGLDPGELLGRLSQTLPQVVDKLTPQGRIPQGDIGGMGELGSLLGGLIGR